MEINSADPDLVASNIILAAQCSFFMYVKQLHIRSLSAWIGERSSVVSCAVDRKFSSYEYRKKHAMSKETPNKPNNTPIKLYWKKVFKNY